MRKRSRYKPKHPPGQVVMPVNIRYGNQSETALQLVPHSELEKLRDGTADDYTWHTVCFRLNWGYVMAGEFFENEEARADMVRSLHAVKAVKARNEATGRWGATGEEFHAMGNGLNLTDEMQKATTKRQQLEAARIATLVSEYKKNT